MIVLKIYFRRVQDARVVKPLLITLYFLGSLEKILVAPGKMFGLCDGILVL